MAGGMLEGSGTFCLSFLGLPCARSYSPRRFASRHVPTAAEELAAHSHFLDPMIIKRFDGSLLEDIPVISTKICHISA
jgi:hypothetical protein